MRRQAGVQGAPVGVHARPHGPRLPEPTRPLRSVGKVVAGLEAENTNVFLQYLYEAATTVPDSSVPVSQVLAEMPSAAAAAPPSAPPPPPPAPEPSFAAPEPPLGMAGGGIEAAPEGSLQTMNSAPMRAPEPEAAGEDQGSKRVRPKSARRPPPKLNSNEVKVEKQRGQEAAPSFTAGVRALPHLSNPRPSPPPPSSPAPAPPPRPRARQAGPS